MGILAKKNMLYLLIFCISISLLTPGLIFANDRGLSFFKDEDIYIQADDCGGCLKESRIISPGIKKKVEEIKKEAISNSTGNGKKLNNEIILFIDPEHQFSDSAVDTLARFKKTHPGWKTRGVILTGLRGLKERLLQKQNYFGNDIEFNVDLNGNIAREFNITKTPSFLIIYRGIRYKISGQPDLNEILSRLDK